MTVLKRKHQSNLENTRKGLKTGKFLFPYWKEKNEYKPAHTTKGHSEILEIMKEIQFWKHFSKQLFGFEAILIGKNGL